MDPNLLTQKTQEVLHEAQTRALRDGHTEVDVEHVLLALLTQPDALVPRLLERAGVGTAAVQADLERNLAGRPRVSGSVSISVNFSITSTAFFHCLVSV